MKVLTVQQKDSVMLSLTLPFGTFVYKMFGQIQDILKCLCDLLIPFKFHPQFFISAYCAEVTGTKHMNGLTN